MRTIYLEPFPILPVSNADTVLTEIVAQEILALTGGGKTREYTETRPDGSTVTYTIDVEEEEYEVRAKELHLERPCQLLAGRGGDGDHDHPHREDDGIYDGGPGRWSNYGDHSRGRGRRRRRRDDNHQKLRRTEHGDCSGRRRRRRWRDDSDKILKKWRFWNGSLNGELIYSSLEDEDAISNVVDEEKRLGVFGQGSSPRSTLAFSTPALACLENSPK